MWFRNLQIYRLPVAWTMTAEQLEARLSRGPFAPTAGLESQSKGWVSPRGDSGLLLNYCPFCGGHPGYFERDDDMPANTDLCGGPSGPSEREPGYGPATTENQK